jgi:hypothetical protein
VRRHERELAELGAASALTASAAEERADAQGEALKACLDYLAELLPGHEVRYHANLDGTIDVEIRTAGGWDFLRHEPYVTILRQMGARLPGWHVAVGTFYRYDGDAPDAKYDKKARFFSHPRPTSDWSIAVATNELTAESMSQHGYSDQAGMIRLFWNPEGKYPDRDERARAKDRYDVTE